MDAGGNALRNQGGAFVVAHASDSSYPGRAVAIGMLGVGADNELANEQPAGSGFWVDAQGTTAVGVGIAAVGQDSSAVNAGNLWINAMGTHVIGAGMAAYGVGNHLENIAVGSDALGVVQVMAYGTEARAAGMIMAGTGSVRNAGNVTAFASGEESEAAGVVAAARGGTIELDNEGRVEVQADHHAAGVYVSAETLPNGDQSHVVFMNTGEIRAQATNRAAGVLIGATEDAAELGTIEVINEGRIVGTSGDGQVAITAGDGDAAYELIKIVNEGTLEGDVDLAAAKGKTEVHLRNASLTHGDVRFGGGENKAWVSTGAAEGLQGQLVGGEHAQNTLYLFRQDGGPEEADMADKMIHFQKVEILSGEWSVDETGLGDRTTIVGEDAVLRLNEPLHLGRAGRLGGNGAVVGNNVVNDQGTVGPGMSIGELTINGDYTHGSNAILEVETRAEAGKADKLIVTGQATLQGGAVKVLPEDDFTADYRGRTFQYTILEAGGDIDGRFGDPVSPSLFLRSNLSYEDGAAGSKAVILKLRGLTFSDLGSTPNEKSIAQILDELHDRDRNARLIEALYSYSPNSESAFRAGLNSMSGEIYTAFPVVSVAAIDRFAQAVVRGMDHPAAKAGRRGWVTAYGTSGKLRGNDNNAGADVKVAGGAGGIQVLAGPNGRLGVTAGFTHS